MSTPSEQDLPDPVEPDDEQDVEYVEGACGLEDDDPEGRAEGERP
jgi:hypothetical protein